MAGRPGPVVFGGGGNNKWGPAVIRAGFKYFLFFSAPGTQPPAPLNRRV